MSGALICHNNGFATLVNLETVCTWNQERQSAFRDQVIAWAMAGITYQR
jgi:hypothetical protein